MNTRLSVLSAVCAAGVLAGCGAGATKTVTVTTPAASATSPGATGATGATTPTGVTSPSANVKAAEAANPAIAKQIAAAVASCKASVNSQPSVPANDRAKLAAICDKAGSGDTTGVQQAASEVCRQIVKDTVPASAQAQASAACPKP